MHHFFSGFTALFKTGALALIILEVTILLEQSIDFRFELRKGFTGTKSSMTRIFIRQGLKLLRAEGRLPQFIFDSFKFLFIFLAAGLLPSWHGKIPLECQHSLWIFILLMVLGPVVRLVYEWVAHNGTAWPAVLTYAERSVGSTTVLLILTITVTTITGADSFSELRALQNAKGTVFFHFPLAILIALSYSVVSLFTAFHGVFARNFERDHHGWEFDDLIPHLCRAVWSIFLVDVFWRASHGGSLSEDILFVAKCIFINLVTAVLMKPFFKLREDQAEALILWRLAPLSIVILVISLLVPRGGL